MYFSILIRKLNDGANRNYRVLRGKLQVALINSEFKSFLIWYFHLCFCFQEYDRIGTGRFSVDEHRPLDVGCCFFHLGPLVHFMI